MSTDASELRSLYPDYDQLSPGQQRILEASLELFAERGYASTSTGSIAKCAGVAEGLIFKHFRSKKELLLKLVRPLVFQVIFPITIQRFQKLLEQEYMALPELLEAILRERLDFARRHRRLLRLLTQEIGLHPEMIEMVSEQFTQSLQPFMIKQFDCFRHSGAIRAMPFQTFMRLIISSIMGYVLSRVLLYPDAEWDDDAEIRQTVSFLVQGLGESGP